MPASDIARIPAKSPRSSISSLPSAIYATYAFSQKLHDAGRTLPQVHLVVKNRITQYMGPASAYAAVLGEIETEIKDLIRTHPGYFTFSTISDGTVEMRDFQTTGVVAFAKGSPISRLQAGKQDIGGHRVQVKEDYRHNCEMAIKRLAGAALRLAPALSSRCNPCLPICAGVAPDVAPTLLLGPKPLILLAPRRGFEPLFPRERPQSHRRGETRSGAVAARKPKRHRRYGPAKSAFLAPLRAFPSSGSQRWREGTLGRRFASRCWTKHLASSTS